MEKPTLTLKISRNKEATVLTPVDVAATKGVSRQAVFQAIRLGALNSVKIGARVYIVVDDLYKAYLKSTPGQRRDLK